jgi:hypothetical protein
MSRLGVDATEPCLDVDATEPCLGVDDATEPSLGVDPPLSEPPISSVVVGTTGVADNREPEFLGKKVH